MTDHLTQRAQYLIEAFEEGKDVRHGLAGVLTLLANAWESYSDDTTLVGVRCSTLEDMAAELTAPTLMERALAGDKGAARQFLFEAGFTDEHGQLTGPYKPEQIVTNLSPQAQAVMDAYNEVYESDRHAVAAALRAAADQVVPARIESPCGEREPWPRSYQLMSDSKWEQRQQTRAELLAIAAELEQTNG